MFCRAFIDKIKKAPITIGAFSLNTAKKTLSSLLFRLKAINNTTM